MASPIDLSIIIVSFNTKKLLLSCINSVRKYTKGINYEIIVVDNGSSDGTQEAIKKIKGVKLILNRDNFGFAAANNQGIKIAQGRHILLLNSDTELKEDSLGKMVGWMEKNSRVGISSCKLLDSSGSTQATGGFFPSLARVFLWATFLDDLSLVSNLFRAYHPHTSKFFTRSRFYENAHQQDWVTGAFFLMRREVVADIGFLDEVFFMYVEEVDYCFRAKKKGWGVCYVPITGIVHIGAASSKEGLVEFGGGTVGKERSIIGEFEGLKIFYKKHYPDWQYGFLILFLKITAVLRFSVYGIIRGDGSAKHIYAKAFWNT